MSITQNGNSALMMAASEGEAEIVSLLVKAGASLDLQNEVNSSLHHSVMLCGIQTYHVLLLVRL